MPKPLVSVIIPTFNGAKYIQTALESVLAQTLTDFEIIVVDDGSHDATVEIVTAMAQKHPRIKLIEQANAGAQVARNRGIAASTGDYIALLDQDDRWLPIFLRRLIPLLKHYPIAFADLQLINSDGEILNKWKKVRLTSLKLPDVIAVTGIVSPSALVFRREIWEEIGPFDQALPTTGDADWLMRAALLGANPGLVAAPLWQYRLHPANTSRNFELVIQNTQTGLDKIYRRLDLPAKVLKYRPYAYLIHHTSAAARYFANDDLIQAAQHLQAARDTSARLFFSLQTFISFLKIYEQVSARSLNENGAELLNFVSQTRSNRREQARLLALGNLTLALLYVPRHPRLALKYLVKSLSVRPLVVTEPGIYLTFLNYSRIYLTEIYFRLRLRFRF